MEEKSWWRRKKGREEGKDRKWMLEKIAQRKIVMDRDMLLFWYCRYWEGIWGGDMCPLPHPMLALLWEDQKQGIHCICLGSLSSSPTSKRGIMFTFKTTPFRKGCFLIHSREHPLCSTGYLFGFCCVSGKGNWYLLKAIALYYNHCAQCFVFCCFLFVCINLLVAILHYKINCLGKWFWFLSLH